MQTKLPPDVINTPAGYRADAILRSCVHCGFCNATCPTYQLLGDELDGPRGRIYLIKQALEGGPLTTGSLQHLDRCLTCRNCETTCPSGVHYSALLDIGRDFIEHRVQRHWFDRLRRTLLHSLLSHPARFARLYRLAQALSFLLPARLKPLKAAPQIAPVINREHSRKVLLLTGCVQPALQPGINLATQRVLDAIGIQCTSVAEVECCGAISYHMNRQQLARQRMRQNIDHWLPYLSKGYEAIVYNASGCGITLKEYAACFEDDPIYAQKARTISDAVVDVSELIDDQAIETLRLQRPLKVAYHAPCTQQHGLRITDNVQALLTQLGFELTEVENSHLCCGSAGTYSILQPELAKQLGANKLSALQAGQPEVIVSANIGCQQHLAMQSSIPVRHWIECVAEQLRQE